MSRHMGIMGVRCQMSWSLTEHDAADVVNTLGDRLSPPGHGDTPLSAARQSVTSNLQSKVESVNSQLQEL